MHKKYHCPLSLLLVLCLLVGLFPIAGMSVLAADGSAPVYDAAGPCSPTG